MAKLSEQDWSVIKDKYQALDTPIRQLGKEYRVAESTIRARAKNEGWQRLKNAHFIEEKVSVDKALHKFNAQAAQLSAQERDIIFDAAKHQLEMQGIFANFERQVMSVVQKEMQAHIVTGENAPDNIVKFTNALKNVRGTPDTQVNVQQNNQTNVLEDIAESISGTLYSKVNERDHG